MTKQPYTMWIEQQYRAALIVFCFLIIIFHPLFHFILAWVPNIPPDSLATRVTSAAVSAIILGIILFFPQATPYSSWLQVINTTVAIFVTHLLVFDSGNHPMYLAASLTSIYGAQSFIRMREWLVTIGLVALGYMFVAIQRNEFATIQGYVPALFYLSNYIIATALVIARDRSLFREWQSRLALEQTNTELRVITNQLQNELALARDIQQSLLPTPTPLWPHFDVVCYSQPAHEVGGDFYSYHQFIGGQVALAVGDVSGKGVSAALLMATSISLLNEHLERHEYPTLLLGNLDRSLVPYTQPRGQNCALCYVELDHHTLYAANAGGISPYIRRVNGEVELIDVGGFALGHGLGAEIGYHMQQRALAPGDLVVLISDGVVEAKNRAGDLFGFPRVEQILAKGPATSAQAMITAVLAEVQVFVDLTEPHDDLTIVAMCVKR